MTTDDTLDRSFDPALNLARASLYRFTALTLIDPRAGSWDELHGPHTRQLVSEAAALVRCEAAARPKPLQLTRQPLGYWNSGRTLEPNRSNARITSSWVVSPA